MGRNCGCGGGSCGCSVIGGAGATVTGLGTQADPYVITAELGDLTQVLSFQDSTSVNFEVLGSGTVLDPLVVSAAVSPSAIPTYTTLGRPSATGVGVGSSYYDLTTHQPMYSDGDSWEPAVATASIQALIDAAIAAMRGTYAGVNAQVGTTYTPVAADRDKLVTLTNAAAITVSLPQDSAAVFPIGSTVNFVGMGAGLVTFNAGSGASRVPTAAVTRAQYSAASATKIAANSWLVVGDLA